jgi:hypothetical protein
MIKVAMINAGVAWLFELLERTVRVETVTRPKRHVT